MNYKKWVVAGFVGFLALILFGGFWHVYFFKDFYYGPMMSSFYRTVDGSKHGQIMLTDLIRGLVLAYLYPFGFQKGASLLGQGIRFGIPIGLLFFCTWVLMTDAVVNVPASDYVLREGIFSFLQGILACVAIGLVYGKNPR
jgi:hypothetical protein